ncbi:MAG TPA: hypothetical protein VG165_17950 [Solirubrobacteraceae bacterium]|jgi:hypothetical protein|nr:hypothetical protein [Solirubrobacteraceae bacterium]
MRRVATAVIAGLTIGLAAPASGLAQTWNAPIGLGTSGFAAPPRGAAVGGGRYAVISEAPSGIIVQTGGPSPGDGPATQKLGDDTGSHPTIAADAGGEAIAAWYQDSDRSIQLSLAPAGGPFSAPVGVSAGAADWNQDSPLVAVSPVGWAAVMFLADDAGVERAYVAVRPPGQSFGAAEPIGGPADPATDAIDSVAIDDRGEAVAGYEQGGAAYAALRGAGQDGDWQPPEALGGEWSGLSASLLQVGIDASGGAVAVWDESGADQADPFTASVMAAFRPAGGVFGPPEGLLDTDRRAPFGLAVSGPGEVILAVAPVDAITHYAEPVVVISGSTALARFGPPSPVAATWEEIDPTVAMDARGDAVLTTQSADSSELISRRRGPFGAFGPAQEILPPPYPMMYNDDGLDRQIDDVGLDDVGNAVVTWTDAVDAAPIMVSLDGPQITSVADVTPPDPLGLTQLVTLDPAPLSVPSPVGDQPRSSTVGDPATQAAPTTSAPSPPVRPVLTDQHVAVVIEHAPPATGAPRIVVAVRCATACRAALEAVLVTPARQRIVLPADALTLDAAGAATGSLRLSPAARTALATPRTSGGRRARARRFELTVTARTGDATGSPQSAVARVSFTRR